MKAPDQTPTVKLIGEDGNAYAIMGRVRRALRKAGADKEYIDEYTNKSISGDYDHLLRVAMEYADVV